MHRKNEHATRSRQARCTRCGLVLGLSTKVERYHALCAARLGLSRGLALSTVCRILDVTPIELRAA